MSQARCLSQEGLEDIAMQWVERWKRAALAKAASAQWWTLTNLILEPHIDRNLHKPQ